MTDTPHEAGSQATEGIPKKGWLDQFIKTCLVLWVLALLVILFVPAVRRGDASPRLQCKNNLKQIALAMHNYHDEHGHFPPAYTVDDQGRRLHSWRTLILPYMEQAELFAKIDITKPWSHPSNSEARAMCPDAFRCETVELPAAYTSYKAVIGPDAAFPENGGTRCIDDFIDGTSVTLLVIETTPDHAVHWMNPHDDDAIRFLEFLHLQSPTAHTGGVQSALADGSVHYLSFDLNASIIKALTTHAGGDQISYDDL